MDLRHIIIQDYQEAIRLLPGIPQELRKSLKAHERVPTFVDNLVSQISRIPPRLKPTRIKIKQIVYDMTNVFVMNVKRKVEERQLSDAARTAIQANAQKVKDLQATAEGNAQGEYEELSQKNVMTRAEPSLGDIHGEDKSATENSSRTGRG